MKIEEILNIENCVVSKRGNMQFIGANDGWHIRLDGDEEDENPLKKSVLLVPSFDLSKVSIVADKDIVFLGGEEYGK